jgi:hypothetical protein
LLRNKKEKKMKRTTTAFLIVFLIGSTFAAQAKTKPDPRKFYLTRGVFNGSQALNACARGYHMASLWEIFDTSNFQYNTDLGVTNADSGSGPPAAIAGWIRTGGEASAQAGFPGSSNCNAYTSDAVGDLGTVVNLDPLWTFSPLLISPWQPENALCNLTMQVWCVQD